MCGTAYGAGNSMLRVAVIDTGIDPAIKDKISLCDKGHRDFTGSSLDDTNGHGSHVSGLIEKYANSAKKTHYCQIILKFFDDKTENKNSVKNMIAAINWAVLLNVDVINISAGGQESVPDEGNIIKYALDIGIKIVAAAGNNGCELSFDTDKVFGGINIPKCSYYPAMYDNRIIVVGNLDGENRAKTSNYGSYVDSWEHGTEVISYCIGGVLCNKTGTSQATAIKTGKIISSTMVSNSSR